MSLFEKYGGTATVGRIVADFYREVLGNPALKPYFDGVPMQGLMEHQLRFMSDVLGRKPLNYGGRSMREAHQHLGVTREHFAEVAVILDRVLRRAGMEDADVLAVMAAVASLEDDVVG